MKWNHHDKEEAKMNTQEAVETIRVGIRCISTTGVATLGDGLTLIQQQEAALHCLDTRIKCLEEENRGLRASEEKRLKRAKTARARAKAGKKR